MLPEKLKQLRTEKKWTHERVAKMVGISRPRYSGYELGSRSPSLEMVLKFAEIHNVTVDYLLGRTEHRPDPVLRFYSVEGLSIEHIREIEDYIEYVRYKADNQLPKKVRKGSWLT